MRRWFQSARTIPFSKPPKPGRQGGGDNDNDADDDNNDDDEAHNEKWLW